MKITKVEATNFQSYNELSFNYSDLGLSLISGPNGSGKSTFMDAVAWGLFGVTSKEVAADEVRAWDASGPTEVEVNLELPSGNIKVSRTRGTKNDLYWTEENSEEPKRGKDLVETQDLLEKRLGVSSELFIIGSYMHQFSKADSFFIAKAKERREVLEKIADQEFPIKLAERASEARKETKKKKDTLSLDIMSLIGKKSTLESTLKSLKLSGDAWNNSNLQKIVSLQEKSYTFEQDKKEELDYSVNQLKEVESLIEPQVELQKEEAQLKVTLQRLSERQDKENDAYCTIIPKLQVDIRSLETELKALKNKSGDCPTCRRPMGETDHSDQIKGAQIKLKSLKLELDQKTAEHDIEKNKTLSDILLVRGALDDLQKETTQNTRLMDKASTLRSLIKQTEGLKNLYIEQLDAAKKEKNPFDSRVKETDKSLKEAEEKLWASNAELESTDSRITSLTWLYDKSFELRGLLMEKVVKQINDSTNNYLERFFDAALRINLVIQGSDKIEIEISNDGFPASFKQLSGGERCMLKLAFSLSLMKAAQNKAGIAFDMIMLDEAFNGLSDEAKNKSFGLFQHLEKEYSTVLCIDHSAELKQNFEKVFNVSKINGHSSINEQQN